MVYSSKDETQKDLKKRETNPSLQFKMFCERVVDNSTGT